MVRRRALPPQHRAAWTAALAGVTSLLAAAPADAYCRTTTCNPDEPDQECLPDAAGCVNEGLPLYWPSRCIHFGVQKDGSPQRGITYGEANAVVRDAFRQWAFADCGGWSPALSVYDLGEPSGGIACDRPEYNDTAGNANVWMFRDTDWPYEGASSTLALTTLTYEVPTGKIVDADVEVNSFGTAITVGDGEVDIDLASIVTHEAGHFLGLSHSNSPGTTMYRDYASGDISLRTLSQDDIDGICAIYPEDPDAPDCEATGPTVVGGFSKKCAPDAPNSTSCAIAGVPDASTPPAPPAALFGLALAAAALGARPRRSTRRG